MPKQTNTGLYIQMHEIGHPIDDILRVKAAYGLCSKMFNGRYRKAGRPFLCHAVGAASSTCHYGGSIDQIIASMFHAAYDSGQFPDGRSGRRGDHPAWLRARLGAAAEDLITRLSKVPFDTGDAERLNAGGIPPGDEDIVLLLLAHEIDDLADGGLVIAPKYGANLESRLHACGELARRIGQEDMAKTFRAYGDHYQLLDWSRALQEPKLEGFRIIPSLRAYFKLRRERWRGDAVEML